MTICCNIQILFLKERKLYIHVKERKRKAKPEVTHFLLCLRTQQHSQELRQLLVNKHGPVQVPDCWDPHYKHCSLG